MKKLAIFGASGHGRVVNEIARLCGWSEITFFDDTQESSSKLSIKGDSKMFLSQLNEYDASFVSIGDNQIRSKIIKKIMSSSSNNLISLIHPSATISDSSIISVGTVVMAGSIINTYSSIGIGAIINTNSVIEHDNSIGNYVHISPSVNIAGGVSIGSRSWVGIGSSIIQNIKIGSSVVIGAGSVVISDIPNEVIAYGVPAKIQF